MIIKKLVVTNGSYQKDGKEKTRWLTIGALHQKEDGSQFITMDRHINLGAVDSKDGKVFVNLFEPETTTKEEVPF
jgi:hypothetical protein